jgi:hypothetical protein
MHAVFGGVDGWTEAAQAPAGQETWASDDPPMVAMQPRKMNRGVTTAGALAVAASSRCISPAATTQVAHASMRRWSY